MFKKIIFILILSMLISSFALADEAVQIELSADKSEVAVGDSFEISVQLKNASTGSMNIGNVAIPGIENFDQRGSSQSTKVQMINGATTAVTETTLTLIAAKEGEYKIGPVKINSGALSAESNVITIKVKASQAKSFFGDETENNTITAAAKGKGSHAVKDWLVNTGALLLLGGLVYALYARKRNVDIKAVSEKETGEITVIPALTAPEKSDERFFDKAKESILLFIREKYGLDAESLTSQEIIDRLSERKVGPVKELIRAIKLCDQGSFALDESGKDELLAIIKNLK